MRDFALQQTGNFRGQSRGDFDLSNMAAMGTYGNPDSPGEARSTPSDSRTRILVSFKAGMEINIGSTSLMMFIYIYTYIYDTIAILYIYMYMFFLD
jgi:hypothetical protein